MAAVGDRATGAVRLLITRRQVQELRDWYNTAVSDRYDGMVLIKKDTVLALIDCIQDLDDRLLKRTLDDPI